MLLRQYGFLGWDLLCFRGRNGCSMTSALLQLVMCLCTESWAEEHTNDTHTGSWGTVVVVREISLETHMMPYYSVSPHPRKNRSGATETNEAWPPTSQSFFSRGKCVMPLLGPLLPPATLFYGTFRNAIRAEMFPPLSKCLAGSQGVQKPVGCAASCPFPSPAVGRRDFCPSPTATHISG